MYCGFGRQPGQDGDETMREHAQVIRSLGVTQCPLRNRLGDWLRVHDPNYGALRRAGRAAIVMPALFALGDKVIGNPTMSYFIAFGSFAMLLLVDFQGTRLDRLRSQALLGVTCIVLICLGTLVSQSTVLGDDR